MSSIRRVLPGAVLCLVLLVAGLIAWRAEDRAAATQPGTPTASAEPELVELIGRYSDGSVRTLYTAPDRSPAPTASPSATATATASPTATLTATTAPAAECAGTVITDGSLAIRREPGKDKTLLAWAQPGQRWVLYAVVYMPIINELWGADEWVRVQLPDGRPGYMAAYYQGQAFVRYDDTQACRDLRWGIGENPFETPTPSATLSPTPTGPAPSPTATATRAPFVSPTPPSMTPPPVTPGAQPKVCELRAGTAVRIRSAPSTSAAQIGTWGGLETQTVHAFVEAGGYLWAQLEAGYSAVYAIGPKEWWVTANDQRADACLDVEGWPEGLLPPAALGFLPRAVGWTTMFGAPVDALISAGETLQGAGVQPAITLTSNALEACAWVQRGWIVNVRPWYVAGEGDHPDMTVQPEVSARDRVAALAGVTALTCPDSGRVWVQLTNETVWPSASYLNRWIAEAVRQCDVRGWRCIPVVFSTGTPPVEYMPQLTEALIAMRRGGHPWGANVGPYERGRLLCDDDAFTAYLTWRVRLLRAAAVVPLPPVWVTEAARSDATEPPIVSDALCFTLRAWATQAYDVVCLWYAGQESAWSGSRWFAAAILEFAARLAAAV